MRRRTTHFRTTPRPRTLLVTLGLTLSIGGALLPPPALAAPDAALARRLDAWAKPLVERGYIAGNLIVARNGEVLAERSYGLAHRELGVAVTPDTRFCIASITKPMTATIATQLVGEGKLDVDDKLSKWIPDFPKGDSITIQMLLVHRAGIPHRVTTRVQETRPMTAAEVAEAAKSATLLFSPNSQSSYSSGGYSLLARVCELASGKSFADLLRERIFEPSGMTRSADVGAGPILEGRAPAYVPGVDGIRNAPLEDLSYLVGAGSVWSTSRDLHRFLRAIVSGKLGEGPRASWVRGGKLAWNGSTNGYRAYADYDSASGLEVVWTGNVHSGANDLFRRAIPRLVRGESVEPAAVPEPARIAQDPKLLASSEAVYQLGNGIRLAVRARDGALYANEWALVPIAPDTYFSPRDFGEVKVVRDDAGRATRLDWKVGTDTWPAPRVGEIADEPTPEL
jgi:CubicO group peptidase (beta-lactamase class C family)